MSRKLDALSALKEAVSNIGLSVQVMSDKYGKMLRHMEEQHHKITNLKKRAEVIERKSLEVTINQKLEVRELQ